MNRRNILCRIALAVVLEVAVLVFCATLPARHSAGVAVSQPARQPLPEADLLDSNVGRKVEDLFNGFVESRFKLPSYELTGGGWDMTLPTGLTVCRDFLRLAAGPVISLGPDAVPHMFKWVRHDNQAIRYLAVFSLQQITGVKGPVGYFADNNAWEGEIAAWRLWWRERQKGKKPPADHTQNKAADPSCRLWGREHIRAVSP